MAKKFQGVYAVVCTPFTQDDKIDEVTLRKHLRFLLDEGKVHGIIPNGSTGEFAALTEEERLSVTEITIDEVKGEVPVVVGTASVSTHKTIQYSQFAQNMGADGVMVVPPYYCHPNDEELFYHYKALSENVSIPIVIYNNPSTSGVDMEPSLIARLAELDRISYVKESSGDMTRVAQIMRLCGDKMKIFCGCDTLALEMFAMGVVGWIAPAANMIPQLCVELFELAVVQKDMDQAKGLYFRLLPLFTMFESTGQYIQLTKAGMDMLGRPVGIPRMPLRPPNEQLMQNLKEILDSVLS
jgi:4-hydroxy-tetrahydrodipicolinate synthase